MHSFRLRLILALIAGVTLLSVASTYFEVLEHKHILRQELEWRSSWIGDEPVAPGRTALAKAILVISRQLQQTRRRKQGLSASEFTILRGN